MTVHDLRGGPPPPDAPGLGATATFMVHEGVVASADLLSCDAGDFHTITLAAPDGGMRLILAGTRHALADTLRGALAELDQRSPT